MARQWLKCAISWSATVVREYRLNPAGHESEPARQAVVSRQRRPRDRDHHRARRCGLAGHRQVWRDANGFFCSVLFSSFWAMWPGWVRVPLPSFVPRVKRPTTIWGAFALGTVFFRPPFARIVRRRLSSCSAQPPRSRRLFLAPRCCLLSPWAAPSRLPLARGRPAGWRTSAS